MLREGGRFLGLPLGSGQLADFRKSDPRKVQLAILLRTYTSVDNGWSIRKPAMGHPGSVSLSVSDGKANKEMLKSVKKLEKMLIRVLTH